MEGIRTATQAMETNQMKQADLLKKIVNGAEGRGPRNVVHVTSKKIERTIVKKTGKSHGRTVNAETEHGL